MDKNLSTAGRSSRRRRPSDASSRVGYAHSSTPAELERAGVHDLQAGDQLVVSQLSDLADSPLEAVALISQLLERGVRLKFRAEGIDTGRIGAQARRLLQAMAALEPASAAPEPDDPERSLQPRPRGRMGGRKPKLSPWQLREIDALIDAGESTMMAIAQRYAVTRATLYNHLDAGRPGRQPVDTQTRTAVQAILHRLPDHRDLVMAILFGSRARGDHRPESDADVALIYRDSGLRTMPTLSQLGELTSDVLTATGIVVQAVAIRSTDWEHPHGFSNPLLLHNIRSEGVPIWISPLTAT